jgi:hypothetical protein
MDEEFEDFRTMPLVGRDRKIELDGANDPSIRTRHEDPACAGAHAGQDLLAPERAAIVVFERDDEADAGAVVHDCVQDLAQHVEVLLERRRFRAGTPLLDPDSNSGRHRLAHGRTIAMILELEYK